MEIIFSNWIQHWTKPKVLTEPLHPPTPASYLPNKHKFTQVLDQDLHYKVLAYFLKSCSEKAARGQCSNLSVHNHVEVSCNV